MNIWRTHQALIHYLLVDTVIVGFEVFIGFHRLTMRKISVTRLIFELNTSIEAFILFLTDPGLYLRQVFIGIVLVCSSSTLKSLLEV